MRRRPSVALGGAAISGVALLAAATASCSPGQSADSSATITVAAAASLTNVFSDVAAAYTAEHPETTITFSFAGSSAIAEQIRQGAPIDVFASAGVSSMQPIADEGLVTDVTDFATNDLQIAVPPGNPAAVTSLADLSGITLIVCQVEVPCGVAATALFDRNDLDVSPSSYESDVRAVLTKIEADEADAGIVYSTDIVAAGDAVVGIEIPAAANVTTTYQAATVAESGHTDAAASFVAFLTTPQAQQILTAAGFGAP